MQRNPPKQPGKPGTSRTDFIQNTHAELIEWAAIATAVEAGPLPEHIEQMPAYVLNWIRIMRLQDPRLREITDTEIKAHLAAREWGKP